MRLMRPGKTEKDRKNRVQERNRDNKDKRVAWQQKARGETRKGQIPAFPLSTCNGKKSRRLK